MKRSVLTILTLLTFKSIFAAELNLSDTPLYLGSSASPNILFLLDDSGSMDWEVMTKDFVNGGRFSATQPDGTSPASSGTVTHRDGNFDGSADCGFQSNGQDFYGYIYGVEFSNNTYGDDERDCNTADDQAWRFRNSDFNPLYFDPTKTYLPWAGVDDSGTAFTNIDIHNAPNTPYNPTETIDLTLHTSNMLSGPTREVGAGFRYFSWTDSDADGLFDNGEETLFLIKEQSAVIQQNFANWFSYYRSREYVAKASYGRVIANASNVRMGLVTLHNNNSVNIAVADMNNDPASGSKRALLDALYSFHSSGGTPLRNSLYQCGRYLECKSNSFFSSCPASSQANGGGCQQNFMVVMTDGFYNSSFSILGNNDGDNNSIWDGGAYADSNNNTLADISMNFYERDLQTTLPNDVPTITGIDEASHQHAVTYTVAFGVKGTLSALPADDSTSFTWPNPTAGDQQKIDDLQHAAYNGRGLYLSASNPQQLTDSLNRALSDIGDRSSSAASVALNSGMLNIDSALYQARFDSGEWSGQLTAIGVNGDGSVGEILWEASQTIENQHWNSSRKIITYNPTAGAGTPFRWNAISTAQQIRLNDDPVTPALDSDGEGSDRLNYLRGDRSNETVGHGYRRRNRVLGDIIHSSPVHSQGSSNHTVFVGSNDGMLHALDASSGAELFAYIPSALFPKLNQLTRADYQHQYYVDGAITVEEVSIGGTPHKILIGGLRGGAQAYYALDITSPNLGSEISASSMVLWEFSDNNDSDMGYSFGEASIVQLNNGQTAAVFGNGYNNTESDGSTSSTGEAVLYMVNISDGSLISKISTKRGSSADPRGQNRPNGLSSPALIDTDNDGDVDIAYAGDLYGNLWKFDLSSSTPSQWKISHGNPANPTPQFKAEIDMGTGFKAQTITVQPEVGKHPSGIGYMVYFGTGQYMETGDSTASDADTQSFYMIWDKDSATPSTIARSDLLPQSIESEHIVTDSEGATEDARLVSKNPVNWNSHQGCYLDLYNSVNGSAPIGDNGGERVISNALLRKDRIIFTTLIPSTQVCGYGGTSWLMEIDAYCEGRLDETPFDFNHDKNFTPDDYVEFTGPSGETISLPGSGIKSKEGIMPQPAILTDGTVEYKYTSGSTGVIEVTTENGGDVSGRRSWRRLQ